MNDLFFCQPKKNLKLVVAPSSKSVMQRIIACSIFCDKPVTIYQPSYCQDSFASLIIAHALGVFKMEGCDTTILKQTNQINSNVLECYDSGLAFRMFVPIAATFGNPFKFVLGKSLQNRPFQFITDVLQHSDIETTLTDDSTFIINGKLKPGFYRMDGSISSQFLTGMLIALPSLEGDSEIEVKNLKSKPYVDLTIQILNEFGINIYHKDYQNFTIPGNQKFHSNTFYIEGDWSNAAFALVLGAISQEIRVKNLNINSLQPDKAILSVLESCGAKIKIGEMGITVSKSQLNPFVVDVENCPDLVPPLVVLAACCEGISTIQHVNRLQYKESNRIKALIDVFGKLGITINYENDELKVVGGKIKGGKVDSYNDHRIAMALGIASFVSENEVEIINPKCVDKSYPDFWRTFFEKPLSE